MTTKPPPSPDDPLLERDAELSALEALLARARAGRGTLVVIEGDAGIGKSRLLLAARTSAEAAGMRVLTARGSELEQEFSFGVARQLLGEWVPGELLDPARWRSRSSDDPMALSVTFGLHSALAGLVRRASGSMPGPPLLLAIDDAQWADDPSLRFLLQVGLRIEDQPIALVVTVRRGEATPSGELLERLRDLPSAEVLTPALLSEAAVAMVVDAAFGGTVDPALSAACSAATGGNPFYLNELLRALRAEVERPQPEHVGQVAPTAVLRSVVVRLARLGDDPARLASAAAIIGDGAPLRLAARLAGLQEAAAEAAADSLARAAMLQPGEPLRFRHPLIAQVLQADMGAFERARAHRRAADLLLAERAPVERVAAHLLVARPQGDRRAVAALEKAAASALSAGTPAVAARLLVRALEEPPAPEDEPRMLMECAKAEALAGLPAAGPRLEQALRQMVDLSRRVDVLVELATLAHGRGDFARAAELAARARTELPPGHPREQELLGIELAAGALHPELASDAYERLEPVLGEARQGRPPSDRRLLALVVGSLGVADPPDAVRPLAETAIAGDPLVGDPYGTSLGWVACTLEWIDELELAERWLDDAIGAADRRGVVIAGATARLRRATVRYYRGRLALAVADGEDALQVYRYGWTGSPWSAPVLAMTHVAMGDLERARERIALGRAAGADTPDHAFLLEAEARLRLAEGDLAGAFESARAAGEHLEARYGAPPQPRVFEWRRLAATAAQGLGDDDQARELLAPDLESLRTTGPARQLGATLTVAGLVTPGEAGLDLLAEAAALLERSPARMQRAETLLALGAALRRAGRRTAAQEPLYAALELAADMGAGLLEQQARDELVRLGLRPRRASRTGVASLTPSERRVAELASEGLTTRQIAQRLHVSTTTIETHLAHVYRKLGISGRRELREAPLGFAHS